MKDRGAIIGRDLFGSIVYEADMQPTPKTRIQRALGKYNYRRSDARRTRCCKICALIFKTHGRYYKCRLVGCSSSPATDINARNVCDAWRTSNAI